MKQMILAKGLGAALALAVMTGYVGQASAGLREYCDSYARDVAGRKTNGGAGAGAITGAGKSAVGGTILGGGVTGDRYKRAYTNAFERCLANYEGTRAQSEPNEDRASENNTEKAATETNVPVKAAAEEAATETNVPGKASAEKVVTEKKVAEKKVAEKKVAANEATAKKVAVNEATAKKVAVNEATDTDARNKACARKYRSWDPQKGKYKSLTGVWRPCRL